MCRLWESASLPRPSRAGRLTVSVLWPGPTHGSPSVSGTRETNEYAGGILKRYVNRTAILVRHRPLIPLQAHHTAASATFLLSLFRRRRSPGAVPGAAAARFGRRAE